MTDAEEREETGEAESQADAGDPSGAERLLDYIKRNRGFDFTGYKRPSLLRRIRKRMQAVGIESFDEYLDRLEVEPAEFADLFNTILINVTTFFRDPPAWSQIAATLPPLLTSRGTDQIRVWSVGCASGQEAYTIAMVLVEQMGEAAFIERVKIYAADIDLEALTQARLGVYTARDVGSVPTELLDKYFERSDARFVFRKDLRRALIFGRHDLTQDPPISRIDLLVCRNMLMYLNAETQNRVVARFHFALNDGGLLFLGRAETLLTHTGAFTPIDLKQRIFTRVRRKPLREAMLPGVTGGGDPPDVLSEPEDRLRGLAFDAGTSARLVMDLRGVVVGLNERARALFSLHHTDVGRPLQDLAVSYRPVELRSCIDQAYAERRPVVLKEVEWPTATGTGRWFDVMVEPLLTAVRKPVGVSVSFADVTRSHELQSALEHANTQLETAYEELQSTNEELETTNEELQSTVEELETTNEELQSTNEELETMNEELQSTNEELQTMNAEFAAQSSAHDRANSFLESVITSFGSALVVVNRDLRVLVWNEGAADLWGLRRDEVVRQPLLSLDIGLRVGELRGTLRACLAGEGSMPPLVLDATNRRGRAIRVRVSCRPLHNSEEGEPAIEGVVIVMEEVQ